MPAPLTTLRSASGAVLALFAGLLLATAAQAEDAVVLHVRDILSGDARQALPIENVRQDLISYYAADDAVPLFVGTDRPYELVERMYAADYDGLDPDKYPTAFLNGLLEEEPGADPALAAEIELWFAAHFLAFASDMKVGRVLPRMVYPDQYTPRKEIDGEQVLRAAVRFPDLTAFLDAWEPYNFEYGRLKEALAWYLDVEAQGGWPTLEPGPDVAPGDSDGRIIGLRDRLNAEFGPDGVSEPADPEVLDEDLAALLRSFQAQHDLPQSGTLDKATLIALNVPVERRIQQIALTMERLRWMPEDISDRMLIVNKGEGTMRLIDDEGSRKVWQVYPNCPRENLSIAAGRMNSLVVNPHWEVPFDYFQTVLFPLLQQDPQGVEGRGFELIYQNVGMPITSLPWKTFPKASLAREKDKFRFRLRPGENNPYGRYVYRIDSMDDAFLFDAPEVTGDELCDPRVSKGAVAVVDGTDLAKTLVRRRNTGEGLFAPSASGRRDTLIIPDVERIPLLIIFQSAWIDENGGVRFGTDPFLEDLKLSRALEGKSSS